MKYDEYSKNNDCIRRGAIGSSVLTKSLLLLLFTIFSQLLPAQLLNYEEIADYNISELQIIANDLGVIPGVIDFNYELKVYKVRYQMEDPNGDPILATGALVVPQEANCGLPIGSYQHGTILKKSAVPSEMSAELNIGLLYATNGFLLTLPDYQGLGESPGLHPYIHADSEARAVVGLVKAAEQLADTLGYPLNDQLFLFGYSQGGHATMAAHRYIQEELAGELSVTASSPMSGPYDVSGVQAEVIVSNEPYPTPNYLPYIIFAYQSVYGNLFNDPSEVFVSPYDTLLPPLFDGTHSSGEVDAIMPSIPNQVLKPALLDSFRNDPNHRIRMALRDNDLYEWIPNSPMRIVYCTGDDQVSFENSIVASNHFSDAGAVDIETVDFGNLDHNGCASFALISGLGYFNRFREENNYLNVDESDIQGSSGMDGSISVMASGGVGGLNYSWSNGETTATISGLAAGTYTLTLSDDAACSITRRYTVDMLTSVAGVAGAAALRLAPNPAHDQLRVYLPQPGDIKTLSLYDMQGRPLRLPMQERADHFVVNVEQLPPGLYLLQLQQGAKRYVGKFTILRTH